MFANQVKFEIHQTRESKVAKANFNNTFRHLPFHDARTNKAPNIFFPITFHLKCNFLWSYSGSTSSYWDNTLLDNWDPK